MIIDTITTLYRYTFSYVLHLLPTVEQLPDLIDYSLTIFYGNIGVFVQAFPPFSTVMEALAFMIFVESALIIYRVIMIIRKAS